MKSIRTDRPFPLPDPVRVVLQRLNQAGHVAYIVGGSVRDFLLGREVKDHDIATDADPDRLEALFPESITVGKAFGVLKVPISRLDPAFHGMEGTIEVATFREDLEYRDHRHPVRVRFAGLEEDARRRDFTINAFYFDPKTLRILDPVGGLVDLEANLIRAIGKPDLRFHEDALRLLRAIRFCHALGFTIEPETRSSIQARARLIGKISSERIRDELTLMLKSRDPRGAVSSLAEVGLLAHILPRLDLLRRHIKDWQSTLEVLGALAPIQEPALGWAALFHRLARVDSDPAIDNPNAMAMASAERAALHGESLKLSSREISMIRALITDLPKFREVFRMRDATLQRWVREPHFEELLKLHRAEAISIDGNLAAWEFCSSLWKEFELKRKSGTLAEGKLLTGEDLIALGLKPGPQFTAYLREVEDLVLEGKLTTKEEALEWILKKVSD